MMPNLVTEAAEIVSCWQSAHRLLYGCRWPTVFNTADFVLSSGVNTQAGEGARHSVCWLHVPVMIAVLMVLLPFLKLVLRPKGDVVGVQEPID
jgi:hypothetical protein